MSEGLAIYPIAKYRSCKPAAGVRMHGVEDGRCVSTGFAEVLRKGGRFGISDMSSNRHRPCDVIEKVGGRKVVKTASQEI